MLGYCQGHVWSGLGFEAVPIFLIRGEKGEGRHPLRSDEHCFVEALLAGSLHGASPLFVVAFVWVSKDIEGRVEGVVRWVEVPLLMDPGGPLSVCFF